MKKYCSFFSKDSLPIMVWGTKQQKRTRGKSSFYLLSFFREALQKAALRYTIWCCHNLALPAHESEVYKGWCPNNMQYINNSQSSKGYFSWVVNNKNQTMSFPQIWNYLVALNLWKQEQAQIAQWINCFEYLTTFLTDLSIILLKLISEIGMREKTTRRVCSWNFQQHL